jgi:uncharacterized membrane protein YdbT with pleckstrin-like domain
MSFKNTMVNAAAIDIQMSQGRNKIGKVFLIIFSIIFLIIAILAFFFSWIVGLVFLGLSALFFGLSKLAKFATKVNKNTLKKLEGMKNSNPNEKI